MSYYVPKPSSARISNSLGNDFCDPPSLGKASQGKERKEMELFIQPTHPASQPGKGKAGMEGI